ncbi:AAA family ATPase [Rhodococcus sp. NPDC127528]|uniref:AAA family ATPase n=1 Tax=unclassified Rhodococcus (in: high G+C Gram-positive bacteria) TaxID=192944 RepID=UPI0036296225
MSALQPGEASCVRPTRDTGVQGREGWRARDQHPRRRHHQVGPRQRAALVISAGESKLMDPTPAGADADLRHFGRRLVALGVVVWSAKGGGGTEFLRPRGWQNLGVEDSLARISAHRPGDALCANMGGRVAVVDVDPRNGGDIEAVRSLLAELGTRVFAEVDTPGDGKHFYIAGHVDLATAHRVKGLPGVDVQSFGSNVFLPGTRRPKYDGKGYTIVVDDLDRLAKEGDQAGAKAFAEWVSERSSARRVAPFTSSQPWDGELPNARERAYLETVLENQARTVAAAPAGGRNAALYKAALKCGSFVSGAGLDEGRVVDALEDAAAQCGLIEEDGEASVRASIESGVSNGRMNPRAVPEPDEPEGERPSSSRTAAGSGTGVSDFEQRVEHELMMLRAREEARRRFHADVAPANADYDDEYLSGDQLDELPEPEPLIEGVLVRHAYGIIRGRDATFKSFIVLDWALSMAAGVPWQGRATERVKVLYIAGEGAYGLAARKRAWEEAHGLHVDPGWFVVRKSPVNLYRGGPDLDHLLSYIEEHGFGFVVLDTLRKMSGGADGNGSDMGVVVDNIDRIRRATDHGSVQVVAHTGKADEDVRGFSGIEDDADLVWSVKRKAGSTQVSLKCAKMKDGPDGHTIDLRLRELGGSLVIEHDDRAPHKQVSAAAPRTAADRIMHVMREEFAGNGATVQDLMNGTGLSQSTIYRARSTLLANGHLVERAGQLFLGPAGSAA